MACAVKHLGVLLIFLSWPFVWPWPWPWPLELDLFILTLTFWSWPLNYEFNLDILTSWPLPWPNDLDLDFYRCPWPWSRHLQRSTGMCAYRGRGALRGAHLPDHPGQEEEEEEADHHRLHHHHTAQGQRGSQVGPRRIIVKYALEVNHLNHLSCDIYFIIKTFGGKCGGREMKRREKEKKRRNKMYNEKNITSYFSPNIWNIFPCTGISFMSKLMLLNETIIPPLPNLKNAQIIHYWKDFSSQNYGYGYKTG